MSTLVYMRASSLRQTTESQKPDLETWCKAHLGSVDDAQWFEDIASGKSMNRPAWMEAEQLIKSGRVKTLVIWRLDRLGRTATGLVKLFDTLAKLEVNLVSLKDGIDLSTPAGRLIANVLASVAAYENEVKSERVVAGMAAAKAKGKKIGGSVVGRRNKKVAKAIPRVKRMHADGYSIRRISIECEITRDTVYRILAQQQLEANPQEQDLTAT